MAEVKTLSQFKSKLSGGGARPNLFEVSIPSFPSSIIEAWNGGDDGEAGTFKFLCRATALPASTVAAIEVPFRGRQLKVAGERTFENWTVTVMNDEDFKLRTAFERWMNTINKLSDNTGVTNPTSYMTDGYVQQLGRGSTLNSATNDGGENVVLRTYKFYDIFPVSVQEIGLAYDSNGDIENFDVSFAVQYISIGDSLQSSQGNVGEVQIS